MRPFTRWPPWMQRVTAWAFLALLLLNLGRCIRDLGFDLYNNIAIIGYDDDHTVARMDNRGLH